MYFTTSTGDVHQFQWRMPPGAPPWDDIGSAVGWVMECCQNASGLDLRLRFALFWPERVRILDWCWNSGPPRFWLLSYPFRGYLLSLAIVLGGPLFEISWIGWSWREKGTMLPTVWTRPLFWSLVKEFFFRRVSLFSLVEVLTLTWSMLGCHNSFITVPVPSWLQFTKLTPMLRLLLNAFAKEITHPFYPPAGTFWESSLGCRV